MLLLSTVSPQEVRGQHMAIKASKRCSAVLAWLSYPFAPLKMPRLIRFPLQGRRAALVQLVLVSTWVRSRMVLVVTLVVVVLVVLVVVLAWELDRPDVAAADPTLPELIPPRTHGIVP